MVLMILQRFHLLVLLLAALAAPSRAQATEVVKDTPDYEKVCGALNKNKAWRDARKAQAENPATSPAEKKRLNKIVARADMRVARIKNMKDRCPPAGGGEAVEDPPLLYGDATYTKKDKEKNLTSRRACTGPPAQDASTAEEADDKCTNHTATNQDKETVVLDRSVLDGDPNDLALIIGHEGSRLSQVLTSYKSTLDKKRANEKAEDPWDKGFTQAQYKERMNVHAINAEVRATDADFLHFVLSPGGFTLKEKRKYEGTVADARNNKIMMDYCAGKAGCPAPKLPVDMPAWL